MKTIDDYREDNMNLNKLSYFISVYEENSITAAARKHFVTQVSMTQQLKSLEADLHVELFIRKNNRLYPTSAAHYLYNEAKELLLSYEKIEDEMKFYGNNEKKLLKIGINFYSVYEYLEKTLQGFNGIYQDVEILFEFTPSNELLTRLDRGNLDLILLWSEYTANTGLDSCPAFTSHTAVLIPEHNPLYTGEFFAYELLANQKIVVLVEELPYFRRTGKLEELQTNIARHTPVSRGNIIISDNVDEALLLAAAKHLIIFTYEDKLYKIPTSRMKTVIMRDSFMDFRYDYVWKSDTGNRVLQSFIHYVQEQNS